MIQSVTI